MAYQKVKYWFDKERAKMLADKIIELRSDFNRNRFIKDIRPKRHGKTLEDMAN